MKNTKKPLKTVHTPNTQVGRGDFVGSGVRAKYGTMKDSYMYDVPKVTKIKPKMKKNMA